MIDVPTITRGYGHHYTPAQRKRELAANAQRYRVPAWRQWLVELPPVDLRHVAVGVLAGAWLVVFAAVALFVVAR